MTKAQLIAKRRRELEAARRECARVLKGARADVARIVRPYNAAVKKLGRTIEKLERVDETASVTAPNSAAELLKCLLACLEDAQHDVDLSSGNH